MLDLRRLRMLAALDDLGTIAAVARDLHLTAPGISMQLAALEREVGVPLTERRGRRVIVTPAGRVLAEHARNIGDMLSVAEMEVAALRDGTAGTYRVAAFPTAARTFVADAWRTLLASPGLGVALRLSELEPSLSIPALAAGEVELAVAHSYSNMAPLSAPGLVTEVLGSENVLLAMPAGDRMTGAGDPAGDRMTGPAGPASSAPSANRTATVDLADFAGHDWVVPHREWACREMVERACGLAGFAPRTVAEATDFSVQLALVEAGAAVALIPALAATALPPGVVVRRLVRPVLRHHFAVTRQASAADPGLARVRALLAEAAARHTPALAPAPVTEP